MKKGVLAAYVLIFVIVGFFSNSVLAEQNCDDGSDNDHDGVLDCDDPGCWGDVTDSTTYDSLRDESSFNLRNGAYYFFDDFSTSPHSIDDPKNWTVSRDNGYSIVHRPVQQDLLMTEDHDDTAGSIFFNNFTLKRTNFTVDFNLTFIESNTESLQSNKCSDGVWIIFSKYDSSGNSLGYFGVEYDTHLASGVPALDPHSLGAISVVSGNNFPSGLFSASWINTLKSSAGLLAVCDGNTYHHRIVYNDGNIEVFRDGVSIVKLDGHSDLGTFDHAVPMFYAYSGVGASVKIIDNIEIVAGTECNDGIDNDLDGLIDLSGGDPGCLFLEDNSEDDSSICGGACIPDCTGGKECGSDGCIGNCGTCSLGQTCESFKCVDIPVVSDDLSCGKIYEKGITHDFEIKIPSTSTETYTLLNVSIGGVMYDDGTNYIAYKSIDTVNNLVRIDHTLSEAGSISVIVYVKDSSGTIFKDVRNVIVYDSSLDGLQYYVAACIDKPGSYLKSKTSRIEFDARNTVAINYDRSRSLGSEIYIYDLDELEFSWRFVLNDRESDFDCIGRGNQRCPDDSAPYNVTHFYKNFPTVDNNLAYLTVSIPGV